MCTSGTAHLLLRLESVHLCEQLVDGVVPLVVAAPPALALPPHGVKLVDEDDAGSHRAGLRGKGNPTVMLEQLRYVCSVWQVVLCLVRFAVMQGTITEWAVGGQARATSSVENRKLTCAEQQQSPCHRDRTQASCARAPHECLFDEGPVLPGLRPLTTSHHPRTSACFARCTRNELSRPAFPCPSPYGVGP